MVQGQALTIGALAQRASLRPSAIRYYERRGILPRPARRANSYRVYDEGALVYLRLLRQTQTLGITLKDARELIRLLQCDQRPCAHVHELLANRLRNVEVTIRDLSLLRGKLRMVLKETSPAKCPPTELCPK
jgi:DNA-binding transcriptional MerR regulator